MGSAQDSSQGKTSAGISEVLTTGRATAVESDKPRSFRAIKRRKEKGGRSSPDRAEGPAASPSPPPAASPLESVVRNSNDFVAALPILATDVLSTGRGRSRSRGSRPAPPAADSGRGGAQTCDRPHRAAVHCSRAYADLANEGGAAERTGAGACWLRCGPCGGGTDASPRLRAATAATTPCCLPCAPRLPCLEAPPAVGRCRREPARAAAAREGSPNTLKRLF